jgi:hypothetical protein
MICFLDFEVKVRCHTLDCGKPSSVDEQKAKLRIRNRLILSAQVPKPFENREGWGNLR